MFTNLNLNNNLIELVEEDIVYNLGEGYMDIEIIEETNDEVEYSR
jgi:hypothetical protein